MRILTEEVNRKYGKDVVPLAIAISLVRRLSTVPKIELLFPLHL
jgi:hypothetical protein